MDVQVAQNSYRKPYFRDFPFFHYNVSHSGEWVACVVHNQPVGIDIEKIFPIDQQLAKQLFTSLEYREIERAENQSLAFYDTWTLKESYARHRKGIIDSFGFLSGK